MAIDRKKSTLNALNKYSEKHSYLPKKKRSNNKPEKEVEYACVKLMRSWGWSVQIFEAKATYSPKAGRWLQQSMKAGTVDCGATIPGGIGAYIEFKAPKRLNTLSDKQCLYIVDKIHMGAFACVVDSAQLLQEIFLKWSVIQSADLRRQYLLSLLPKKKVQLSGETELDF